MCITSRGGAQHLRQCNLVELAQLKRRFAASVLADRERSILRVEGETRHALAASRTTNRKRRVFLELDVERDRKPVRARRTTHKEPGSTREKNISKRPHLRPCSVHFALQVLRAEIRGRAGAAVAPARRPDRGDLAHEPVSSLIRVGLNFPRAWEGMAMALIELDFDDRNSALI